MKTIPRIIQKIREIYQTDQFIALHEPVFLGNEKKYVCDAIDSTFVSSVGAYVDQFEERLADFAGAKYAIAMVNGTAALHIALLLAGVEQNDEVITQPITFVATANAIAYLGAKPIFVDVDADTLGLSPTALRTFLETYCENQAGQCINQKSGKVIKACVPMHTFGHPCRIDEIVRICDEYGIVVVEDAAESLGSWYQGQHTGRFGKLGTFSFNGNKIITSGGGGAMITDEENLAKQAKHLTTTAKIPHRWEYAHDRIGYNYRMPNLNAALLVAQMENLPLLIEKKRLLAQKYQSFFQDLPYELMLEPPQASSNYWLNAIVCPSIEEKKQLLEETNQNRIMTRPLWKLMNHLAMFRESQTSPLPNASFLENRIVNIPSGLQGLV